MRDLPKNPKKVYNGPRLLPRTLSKGGGKTAPKTPKRNKKNPGP